MNTVSFFSKTLPRLLTAVGLLVASSALQGGEITGFTWSSGIASVALDPITMPTPDLNNDEVVGGSLNEILVTQKDYIGNGPVDIEFTVKDSGGVTEYTIVEGIQNGTGGDWSDYHIQLGFGKGADFVPSPAGDGLDFDAPDYNSPALFAPFATVVVSEDDIDAYGGLIPSPSFTFPFVFNIDVPDGITAFTVRQYPTTDFIPEPSGALLALLGVAITGARFRRLK